MAASEFAKKAIAKLKLPSSTKTLTVERIRLDSGGYRTSTGKYYGIGEKVWRVYSDDMEIDTVVRAKNATLAKQRVRENMHWLLSSK